MLPHLANPWILARIVLGIVVAALAWVSAAGALRILAQYRDSAYADERTLQLEQQSELLATVLSVAFALQLVASVFTVLLSDRLAGSIRGAMCAYGVFGSNAWGATALGASLLAAVGSTAWLAIRRVDVRLRRGSLVRTLAGGSLAVTALVTWDLAATLRYLFGLDLEVVATCCSVFVDRTGTAERGSSAALTTLLGQLGPASLAGVCALLLAAWAWRRTSALSSFAMGTVGLAAAWLAWSPIVSVIAPYVYETPDHRCPYCLLHREAWPAGPLVLGAWFVALLLSSAAIAVSAQFARPGARSAASDVVRRLAFSSVCAWLVLGVAGAAPALRYRWISGTFDLFR